MRYYITLRATDTLTGRNVIVGYIATDDATQTLVVTNDDSLLSVRIPWAVISSIHSEDDVESLTDK